MRKHSAKSVDGVVDTKTAFGYPVAVLPPIRGSRILPTALMRWPLTQTRAVKRSPVARARPPTSSGEDIAWIYAGSVQISADTSGRQ